MAGHHAHYTNILYIYIYMHARYSSNSPAVRRKHFGHSFGKLEVDENLAELYMVLIGQVSCFCWLAFCRSAVQSPWAMTQRLDARGLVASPPTSGRTSTREKHVSMSYLSFPVQRFGQRF